MKLKDWGAFALLGVIWGSSFLWIKVGQGEPLLGLAVPAGATAFSPFLLVAFRLLFGLLGMVVVLAWQRPALPRDPRTLLAFLFMGVFNTALPFVLITWGETLIDSSLASILNATVPLFTILFAHFWLHDEKITASRLVGLAVGFGGVVILVSRDLAPGGLGGNIWGQAAVIAAAVSYAVALTFSRRYLRNQKPAVQSFMVLLFADALLWVATPVAQWPLTLPTSPLAWFAVAWLGLLGSCVAYLLFFHLNNAWGPTRASLVTYTFPVIGLLLGVALLGERPDWRLLAGSALVISGIVAVNARSLWQSLRPAPAPLGPGEHGAAVRN
ncbi:MAG: DMT family transporter [Anaerolineales bacterium]|nr:DMT family transporter [Anaerolineales bacterium]